VIRDNYVYCTGRIEVPVLEWASDNEKFDAEKPKPRRKRQKKRKKKR
jgi:hypothetical protein